jgi:hypothetical protein
MIVASCGYRHSVLSLIGPSSGTCDPGCAVTLNWLFNPLAACTHSIAIPITIHSADTNIDGNTSTHTLTVFGRGYHPGSPQNAPPLSGEAMGDDRAFAGWCDVPAIPRNALLAASTTAVHLGVTELQGVMRRLVVLHPAGDMPVHFQWRAGIFCGGGASDGTLHVEPENGDLLPGESVVCQVIYQAGVEAQRLDGEITVHARALSPKEMERLMADGAMR